MLCGPMISNPHQEAPRQLDVTLLQQSQDFASNPMPVLVLFTNWTVFQVFLVLKCTSSIAYAIMRTVELSVQLREDSFSLYPAVWSSFITGVAVGVNCMLCWAYTAERVLATVLIKTYERQKPWFGVVTAVTLVSSNSHTKLPTTFAFCVSLLDPQNKKTAKLIEL